MQLRDIGLFIHSARTDQRLRRIRSTCGEAGSLDALYELDPDPWRSADPTFRYQRAKYQALASLIPGELGDVLDVGCGTGVMTRTLAERATRIVGVDVARPAIETARRTQGHNVSFVTADLLNLNSEWDQSFDLIVLVDVLYYLSPLTDDVIKSVASRMSNLLRPNGRCLLANHFFFGLDPDSRRSRHIRDGFRWSSAFSVLAEHRRPFYVATLLRVNRE